MEDFTMREGGASILQTAPPKAIIKKPVLAAKEVYIQPPSKWVHCTPGKHSRPILTVETLKQFCEQKKIEIRYNVIAKDVEIFVPDERFPLENQYSLGYAYILSALKANLFDLSGLDEILLLLATRYFYNPIADWIKSNKWDGRRRFKDLCNTVESDDDAAKEIFLFRWMITAVAAVFEPEGIGSAGMLVLQGNQHIGKTYWLRQLLPENLRHFFKSGLALDPHDKDSVKVVVSHWIVELGELDATFRKSDIAALKAFIREQYDSYRPQYARRAQKMPRRTVLAGTVNSPFFLADNTGNSRFWTVGCKNLDSRHTLDMQQIWAEIYEYYQQGEKWELNLTELSLINEKNSDYEILDYVEEKIQGFYDWSLLCTEWKSAQEIADQIGIKNPSKSDMTKIGQMVVKINGGKRRKTNGKRLLGVPPKI